MLANYHKVEARRYMREGGRKRATTYIDGGGRGNTLNVGSRSSNYYGRIYDKHRESGDDAFRRCWRYEVEAKNDAAEVFRQFINSNAGDAASIASLVAAWFGDRGIGVRYRPGVACALAPIGADPTDDIRTLKWLRAAVAPALARLLERYTRDALVAWLFDCASMEQLGLDRATVGGIARSYGDRGSLAGFPGSSDSAKQTERKLEDD
jgi:hypothetical protein